MSESPNSRALVSRAQRGDTAAFGELIERYRGQLEATIVSLLSPRLRQKVDVQDLVQQVSLRAFKALDRFECQKDGDGFSKWLKGIARHAVLKTAEKENKKLVLPLLTDVPASDGTPSQALRRDERFDRLESAVDGLSSDHRQVILLARIEKLPLSEIGRRMERSTDAVKQLLRRALKELKSQFGETESLHLPERSLRTGKPVPPP
jgi:RNA polymerase sigma-70 factor (ECF subfamily)